MDEVSGEAQFSRLVLRPSCLNNSLKPSRGVEAAGASIGLMFLLRASQAQLFQLKRVFFSMESGWTAEMVV